RAPPCRDVLAPSDAQGAVPVAPQRGPRNERDAGPFAGGEYGVRRALSDEVFVLHRDDGRDLARLVELAHRDVRHPEVSDLAGTLQLRESAHRLCERNVRVGGVELIEVDALEAKALQAAIERAAQMLRAAAFVPPVAARTDQPTLGGDHELLRIGMQSLGDELLRDVGPIAVGG